MDKVSFVTSCYNLLAFVQKRIKNKNVINIFKIWFCDIIDYATFVPAKSEVNK